MYYQLYHNLCSLIIILFKETVAGWGAKEIWDLAKWCAMDMQRNEDILYRRRLCLMWMPEELPSRQTLHIHTAATQDKSSTRVKKINSKVSHRWLQFCPSKVTSHIHPQSIHPINVHVRPPPRLSSQKFALTARVNRQKFFLPWTPQRSKPGIWICLRAIRWIPSTC